MFWPARGADHIDSTSPATRGIEVLQGTPVQPIQIAPPLLRCRISHLNSSPPPHPGWGLAAAVPQLTYLAPTCVHLSCPPARPLLKYAVEVLRTFYLYRYVYKTGHLRP